MQFGQEVRRHREAAGLTLEALAERSGLTPNYIGGIETGKRDPSLSTVLSLARGLSVSPAELLGGLGNLSPEAIEAGRLFEGTLPEVQGSVLRFLRTVARLGA